MSRRRIDLAPGSALLHPLWLSCALVLALNDHVLKGSGLLPGIVTGKLSDFAGLIVAPALLAVVLRVRTRAGWTIAHVAVGAVFAAIQLFVPVADAWSSLMGAIGFPWRITMDPTDLIALPALVCSHVVLRDVARRSARPALQYGAATVGLLCCAATSPPPGEPFRAPIFTDVYVHNSGDTDLVIRVRKLAASVDVDCARVAQDPGRLLGEPLFGPAETWVVPPGVNHGLYGNSEFDELAPEEMPEDRDCRVVLFDADNVSPRIIFWQLGDPPEHSVDGEEFDPEDRGAIDLQFDDEGRGRYATGDEFVFVPVVEAPITGSCAPQDDATRLDWSTPLPTGAWTITAIERGFDGCFAIDLATTDAGARRWYLCAPMGELPFVAGDLVSIEARWDSITGEITETEGVVVTKVGGEEPGPATELHITRGATLPTIQGLLLAEVPEFECDYAAEPVCGTAARATSLTVGGGTFGSASLRPGEPPAELSDSDGNAVTVWLAHAQDRVALDPECALGPDMLGTDLEIAAVFVPAAQ